jgi:peptide/nickel transport system permease protein
VSTPEEQVILAEHPVPEAPGHEHDETRIARGERIRLLLRSKTFLTGSFVLGVFVFCAVFGELVAPYDPLGSPEDILNKLQPPSSSHFFGTDQLGRDVFSRVIAGARDILTVAPAATLLGTVLGAAIGLITGYFRGVIDDVLMRIVDAFLAIPLVILGVVALVALGPSKGTVIVVIGIVFAPIIARTVRAAVLSERELEYVQAARLRNASSSRSVSATRSSRSRRSHSSASASSRQHPTGDSRSRRTTSSSTAATGGRRSFRRSRLPRSSPAST